MKEYITTIIAATTVNHCTRMTYLCQKWMYGERKFSPIFLPQSPFVTLSLILKQHDLRLHGLSQSGQV